MGVCKDLWVHSKNGHFRAPSFIYDHANTSGHHNNKDNVSIMGRESHKFTRTIKETIYIRVKDQSLNRNIGN